MDHGDELMKPLTLPPPTKGPRALALSTVDAAGLLLRPSRQPMSDKLLRVWEHKREESAHYVPPELLDYELPRLSAGGRPVPGSRASTCPQYPCSPVRICPELARNASRPPLSQDQELLMEGIRRSQQQQADSGSEIGDDYRPFVAVPAQWRYKERGCQSFCRPACQFLV
uniref:Uncharacterized protein n=1 Tax=Macrostomum lignano TaxID=282301 RepID=A0A1I8F7I5_9PLAT